VGTPISLTDGQNHETPLFFIQVLRFFLYMDKQKLIDYWHLYFEPLLSLLLIFLTAWMGYTFLELFYGFTVISIWAFTKAMSKRKEIK